MKMDELKNRKTTRLKCADYNRDQAVFLSGAPRRLPLGRSLWDSLLIKRNDKPVTVCQELFSKKPQIKKGATTKPKSAKFFSA